MKAKSRPTLLDRVLSPGGLRPLYQPIFEISAARPRLCGAECLTRGPEGTNLEPADLLFAYARHKRAEAEVDRAAISTVLSGAGDLAERLELHVNVHASTLARDTGFSDFVASVVREASIAPANLTLEVIEESNITDRDSFQQAVASMRGAGHPIALDDVGLGRSNFLMIYLLRPQVLKADRFFVRGISGDPLRRAVMASVQTLAGELGACVVAEGVEEEEDLKALRDLGIHRVQGFLLSPPITAEQLRDRLAQGDGEEPPPDSPRR